MKKLFRQILGIYTCYDCGKVFVTDESPVVVWNVGELKKLGYSCCKGQI